MKQSGIKKPVIPLAFLRWYCDPSLIEDVEGDLNELYDIRKKQSLLWAKVAFWRDVMFLFRPGIIKSIRIFRFRKTPFMYKNYFKTSIRNCLKNPVSTTINIFGLAIAIGICVLGFAFIRYTFKMDQFHVNKDNIHLITFNADRDGELQRYGMSPVPLGEMLAADFPQVEKMSRLEDKSVVVKYDANKVFHEKVRFADPDFLDMFSFQLKWGESDALRSSSNILISQQTATKYFGSTNPIGETLRVIFEEGRSREFSVAGVFEDFYAISTIDFDFLINYSNVSFAQPSYDANDWEAFNRGTLVLIKDRQGLDAVADGMDKYRKIQNAANDDWQIASFGFEPISTLFRNSASIRRDISTDSFEVLYMSSISFIVIGFFVIALASTNYINIAIVSATKRLKEIGLRKVIGATKRMVMAQFLFENMLLMFLALVLGVIMGVGVFIPWLEDLQSFDMAFELNDRYLWLFLPVILIITSIISGSYPAYYIAKFQVAAIFRNTVKFGKRNLLTRVFLAFQLILATMAISLAVMFSQNSNYQIQRSWGYDQEQVLYAKLPEPEAFQKLQNALSQNPKVVRIAGSTHHIGQTHKAAIIESADDKYEVQYFAIDSNYFATLDMEIINGTGFEGQDRKSIVVNETFAKQIGASGNLVGNIFTIDSIEYVVAGIVRDVFSYGFYTKIKPAVYGLTDSDSYRYISIQAPSESLTEVRNHLKAEWVVHYPEIPFDGGFQNGVWGNFEQDEKSNSGFWKGLATAITIVAALALYGLITLNISGRTKEFSVRKVLGAPLKNIASIVGKQYLYVFLIAIFIGTPVSYELMKVVLEMFMTYHMPVNYSFTFITVGVLMTILVTVIMSQVLRIRGTNPVEGLKTE